MTFIKTIIQILMTPIGVSFLTVIACLFYYFLNRVEKKLKQVVLVLTALLFAFVFYMFIMKVNARIHAVFVWDFSAWFLWSKVAVQDLNFYLPENLQAVYASLNLPEADYKDFVEAIVNVGFLYPPPTMFLFYLLGYLDYNTALTFWTIFVVLTLFYCIYLIQNQFFSKNILNGLLLVSIVMLLNPSVNFTIYCSQTNFIVLLLILLMKKYSYQPIAGIFLALAFFTKPFLLIFGIYFLATRKWNAIAYFIGTAVVVSALSIVSFGSDTFLSYFFDNPTQRLPAWTYSEDINQSLNAILLRANILQPDNPQIYFIIAAVLLSLTGLFTVFLQKKDLEEVIWSVLLLVGLLIYPGTLSYYAATLFFVVFQFFDKKEALHLDFRLVIPIIGLLTYINSISVFACICFLLIIVIAKTIWLVNKSNSTNNHLVVNS
jgi:hypothetical protein